MSAARLPALPALDGLRGVAALAVFSLHYQLALAPWWSARAFLAVDLFFVISGAVIAWNYDARLGPAPGPAPGPALGPALGIAGFMRLRLIRLYPLYALGLVLSVLPVAGALLTGAATRWTWPDFARALGCEALMLPNPWSQTGDLYGFNIPAWSLWWELVINALYAVAVPRLGTRAIIAVTGLCGLALAVAVVRLGTIDFGFRWPAATALVGLARVGWGFGCGVVIARWRRARGRSAGGRDAMWLLGLIGVEVLMLTVAPQRLALAVWAGDLVAALVVAPALVVIASGLALAASPRAASLSRWLGLVSFPLYILHAPLLKYLYPLAARLTHRPVEILAPWGGMAMAASVVAVSLVAGLWYDPVVRRRLAGLAR